MQHDLTGRKSPSVLNKDPTDKVFEKLAPVFDPVGLLEIGGVGVEINK